MRRRWGRRRLGVHTLGRGLGSGGVEARAFGRGRPAVRRLQRGRVRRRWHRARRWARGYGWNGAAWVFGRSGGTWAQQAKLTRQEVAQPRGPQRRAVDRRQHGARRRHGRRRHPGAGWVFTRAGGSWEWHAPSSPARRGNGRAAERGAATPSRSRRVAGTVPIGATATKPSGAAWLFSRESAGPWAQQGAKLGADDALGFSGFGWGVALSADAGTPCSCSAVYTRICGSWATEDGARRGRSHAPRRPVPQRAPDRLNVTSDQVARRVEAYLGRVAFVSEGIPASCSTISVLLDRRSAPLVRERRAAPERPGRLAGSSLS